jgi:hypothetical protein
LGAADGVPQQRQSCGAAQPYPTRRGSAGSSRLMPAEPFSARSNVRPCSPSNVRDGVSLRTLLALALACGLLDLRADGSLRRSRRDGEAVQPRVRQEARALRQGPEAEACPTAGSPRRTLRRHHLRRDANLLRCVTGGHTADEPHNRADQRLLHSLRPASRWRLHWWWRLCCSGWISFSSVLPSLTQGR